MSAIQIPRVKAAFVLKVLSRQNQAMPHPLARDEDGNDVEVVLKWRSGPELKAIWTAWGLFRTLAAMMAPCSVKAWGR